MQTSEALMKLSGRKPEEEVEVEVLRGVRIHGQGMRPGDRATVKVTAARELCRSGQCTLPSERGGRKARESAAA